MLIDGCGYCRLLFPSTAPCRRCGGRHRLQPARMLDAVGVAAAVARAVAGHDASRAALDGLLELLLVHAPVSLAALAALGAPTLDDLRRVARALDAAGA